MNSTRSSTSSSARFFTSRAQLSPLGRRSSVSTATNNQKATVALSVPRTVALRGSAASTLTAAESFGFPSFWSSGALDRLQPEVTRYHE